MTRPPAVRALRLLCAAKAARTPAPFLGVRAFGEDPAAAIAVLLDVDPSIAERAHVEAACLQIPDAAELAPGQRVFVLPDRASARGILGRLFGARASVSRAVRATALLARGYTNLGAGVDDTTGADLVWGEATRSS